MLNLNLSNLLLLLVLKAVVFGAGYFGNHGYKGRELEQGFALNNYYDNYLSVLSGIVKYA